MYSAGGENSFVSEFTNFEYGKYEFRIGAISRHLNEPVFSEIFSYRDSTDIPYNLSSEWIDSTSAILKWDGSQMHENYRVEYRNLRNENWQNLGNSPAADYSISTDYFSFGSKVSRLNHDSSYIFRVVAIDIDNEEVVSKENYLRKKETEDPILKLKEKSIVGKLLWTFSKTEEDLGRASGTPAFFLKPSKNKNQASTEVLTKDLQPSNKSYPLEMNQFKFLQIKIIVFY